MGCQESCGSGRISPWTPSRRCAGALARRLLDHRIGQALFDRVVVKADRQGLLSDEHFSVDGTLIEAAASIKSFRRQNDAAFRLWGEPEDSQADRGDIRVDEDGGRVPPNPVSGCGAYWAGWLLRRYRLQLGADGEPVVVSEDSGRSGRVTCRGAVCPSGLTGPTSLPNLPRNRPPEYEIPLRSHQNVATAYSIS